MGKGDKYRPMSITLTDFSAKWDLIFSKKCLHCEDGILIFIKADEPYHSDHYQCDYCDSTYNIGQV